MNKKSATQKAIAAYNNVVGYKQADTTALFNLTQLLQKSDSYKDAEKTYLLLINSLGTTEAALKKSQLSPLNSLPVSSRQG